MKKLIESETLELKTSLSELNDIIETITAFANVKGGELYIGINPNGKVVGVSVGANTIENLASDIRRDTDPSVFPNIDVVRIKNKDVIKITVQEFPIKPVFAKGKVFIRVGKSNQKASADEIRKLINAHSLRKWDRQTNRIPLTEISSSLLKIFLNRIEEESDTKFDGKRNKELILKRFELIDGKKPTNASILLFSKNPQKHFISSFVKCAKFKGTEAIDFEDFQDIKGSLIEQIPAVLNFIRKHINVRIEIKGKPERDEIWEVPKEALREAVINAICHRDYESTANVQVRIFDDRIEIWNPGILPPEITLEQLKTEHPSIPRNELIAQTFYRLRLIENWGTGTNRIIRLCKEAGVSAPIFSERVGTFITTFKRSKVEPTYTTSELTKTQQAIIEYLRRAGEASTSDIVDALEIHRSTIQRNIKELTEYINWTGSTPNDPSGKYKLKGNF